MIELLKSWAVSQGVRISGRKINNITLWFVHIGAEKVLICDSNTRKDQVIDNLDRITLAYF